MNILIETIHSPYSGDRVGGAETSLRLIAEKMVEKGHKVFFLTKQQDKTFLGYSKKNINGVKVITYSKFKVGLLNRVRVKKILQNFIIRHQKSFIKRKEIQVVHTYYNYSLLKKYVLFKGQLDFKLIIRIAGLRLFEEIDKKGRNHQEAYIELFNKVDKFNFISDGLLELFYLKKKEYNFIYDFKSFFIKDIGVVINRGRGRRQNFEEKKNFQIVMVSRLSAYQKRQDILIDAIAKLNNPNIHLTIIGEGPNRKQLEKQAISLNIQNFISFKAFIRKENLWESLEHFDLLVHACDYEGLSKIIIESMASGLPVLASDVLPLNSYIVDGSNGFLVANDIESWADKIEFLYLNHSLFPNVIKNAIRFIEENYNADNNILIYESEFQKS